MNQTDRRRIYRLTECLNKPRNPFADRHSLLSPTVTMDALSRFSREMADLLPAVIEALEAVADTNSPVFEEHYGEESPEPLIDLARKHAGLGPIAESKRRR